MKRFRTRSSWINLLCVIPLVLAVSAWAQEAKTFSKEELDQMMAPIALYPDSLLSQVLMASTYPAEVAEAVSWSKANPSQKGDAAVKAVESQPWDPSVQSLVAFPQVLAMMGEKPDWVQKLGDAFLAEPDAVMDSAQRLRAAAQKAGNLKTTEQQKVIEEPAPQGQQQTVIKIEPANPQVVYVPTYNPTVVYGPWWYPAYPPYYWPVPGYPYGSALARGIAFGTGIAITNALWGGFNWGRHDVNINVNRYNNINVNKRIDARQNNVNWKHNAADRRGVPYRDAKSREQYGKQLGGADKRQDFRGRDASRDASRQQAQAALQNRGMDPARERQQLRNNPQTRDRAQAAARNTNFNRDQARAAAQNADRNRARQAAQNRGGDNALRGAGNAAQTRQQVNRGNASRQSMAQHGGGARAGGGGARGGGGGRGGGGRRR